MPETYTNVREFARKVDLEQVVSIYNGKPSFRDGTTNEQKAIVLLNSALSTAEQERDALKDRCAELEARLQGAGWISVKERLPEIEKFVLANVEKISLPIRAFYAAPSSVEGNCEDEISIFDEEADCYWLPAGWYETNEYEEVSWFVHGKVTHWMPLPEPPAIVGKKEGL